MENVQIQKLLDANPDAVFIAERKSGRILFSNKIFSRKLYGGDDFSYKNLFEITSPSEKENLHSLLERKINEGEFHFKLKDGRLIRHKLFADEFDGGSVLISFEGERNLLKPDFHAELINKLNDAVTAVNLNLEIISWNKAAERMYGWTESEALGKNISGLLRTEMTEAERKRYLFDLETKGSVQQVITRRHKNGSPVFIEASTISIHDSSGKVSGFVSVNRDISARLETLEQLKRSEERYKKIFDENPLPIIIYKTADYSIIKANKAAINKYQYSAEEFEMMKVPELLPPGEKQVFSEISAENSKEKKAGIFYTINKSSERIYTEYTSTPISYKGFDARLVVMNDITENQKAKENMYDSSSKLETIVENLPMILLELDNEGKFILEKGKALAGLEIKPDELVGKSALEIAGELDVTQHNGEVISVSKVIHRVMNGEVIAGHTNWTGRYFDNYFVPVRKAGNKVTGMLGICLDITERVNFEKSFHNTEERFRLIADNTSDLIAMVSDKKYIYVSPSYEKVFGYSIDEIKEIGPGLLVHPEDRPALNKWRESGIIEFRVRNKIGEWLWVEGESFLIPGDPEIVVGIAREITKRKRAEEGLRESEERYRVLFERNPLPMFVYDEETYRFVAVNEVAITHYGYTKKEFLKMTIKDIRPEEDVPALVNILTKQYPGMNRFGKWRHRKKNGTIIDVDVTTHQITINGRLSRIVLANDVTETVKAERALKESEDKYRIIVENANEGILLLDQTSKITFVNPKLASIVGYKRDEVENRSVLGFLFEEDRESALNYISQNREGNRETFEFRLKHKDGSERWVVSNAVPIFDENNYYKGGLALITDITQQRKAETVLHRTNEMLRALINYSPLSVVILDKEGKTELWNPASERIFGWSSEEIIGKTLPFVPEDKAEEHLQLRRIIMEGESFTGKEVVRVRKDRKKINVSISASPLFDSDHHPIGISSFLIDVTDKKIAEKEREKLFKQISSARNRLKILSAKLISVQEAEKRNISRELHDEIGQMLTAIKIDLQRIKDNPSPGEISAVTDDCTRLIEKTISVVRNLSLELRPSIIDDLGLAASLRWYADKFSQRTGITVKTEIKKIEEVLPAECAITLFRICQEALTNIAKHSEAEYVKITLNQNNSAITLTIEDNGKGFDLQKALKQAAKGKSLGLLGMQERAELLGGSFRIKSTEGSGTLVKATCQV